ncbi:MAG: hypothetical protein JKY60_13700 [Kordiimonadaceae bacterium]|nr:hypothetical protein [Kordiimonadaceae bacterium]
MTELEQLLETPPYSLSAIDKAAVFNRTLAGMTQRHFQNCSEYRKMLNGLGFDPFSPFETEDLPFLPVRLFKEFTLKSIPDRAVHKTMHSSGTSGQQVSKIYLDKATALNQSKVLSKIMGALIGTKRLPMLVIDAKETVGGRGSFSARSAGIRGFSMFGRGVTYALHDSMKLDYEAIEKFATLHRDTPVFIFGFTSIIYQHFIQELQLSKLTLSLANATLVHGGGWKKLIDVSVDNNSYKGMLKDVAGIAKVHNYYGMVEQTGSIFTECDEGHLHSSIFSDIIIRRTDLSVAGAREKGLIQLISLLPESYPGHSILTEDIGELLGEDDCSCGKLGRYFKVYGRAAKAEVRGCSDVY